MFAAIQKEGSQSSVAGGRIAKRKGRPNPAKTVTM